MAPKVAVCAESMKEPVVHWQWRSYKDLSRDELYAILALRQHVFVVEQECFYQDADGLDQYAFHLMGFDRKGILRGYLRLIAPGKRFAEPSIGRVVVHPEVRCRGLGRELMVEGIRKAEVKYPGKPIRISAQQYLEGFYRGLGFELTGEPYDEDGILHVQMLRPARRH